MLIISHDDHIVRHDPLLFSVILHIMSHRHIIVHRKDQAVLPAAHRQFADKLDIVLPTFLRDPLKVYVDPVNPCLQGVRDQLIDQFLPAGCRT